MTHTFLVSLEKNARDYIEVGGSELNLEELEEKKLGLEDRIRKITV